MPANIFTDGLRRSIGKVQSQIDAINQGAQDGNASTLILLESPHPILGVRNADVIMEMIDAIEIKDFIVRMLECCEWMEIKNFNPSEEIEKVYKTEAVASELAKKAALTFPATAFVHEVASKYGRHAKNGCTLVLTIGEDHVPFESIPISLNDQIEDGDILVFSIFKVNNFGMEVMPVAFLLKKNLTPEFCMKNGIPEDQIGKTMLIHWQVMAHLGGLLIAKKPKEAMEDEDDDFLESFSVCSIAALRNIDDQSRLACRQSAIGSILSRCMKKT